MIFLLKIMQLTYSWKSCFLSLLISISAIACSTSAEHVESDDAFYFPDENWEEVAEDLKELKDTYWLTESITIRILPEGKNWLFQIDDGEKEKVVSINSHLWKVPGLDIVFYGKGRGENLKLRIKRYEETVSLSPSPVAPDLAKEYEAASVPEIVERLVPRLMIAWHVPGVSVAVIRNNSIRWLGQYGIKRYGESETIGPETVFEAASMSKPVFAYVALQLVEEGIMDLDSPLVNYLGEPYTEGVPLHEQITARMVMSHTSGFPNWRSGGWRSGNRIPVLFEPGTEFRYSGEGFLFLQRVVEKLTGNKAQADELMKRRLLEPLHMDNSSYIWQASYNSIAASGHDKQGEIKQQERSIYRATNVAYTLYTTPEDYAKFLIEMMKEDRSAPYSLSSEMLDEMMAIQSDVPDGTSMVRRNGTSALSVHFGLGWKIETLESGPRYVHTGSNGTGFRCMSEFNPQTGNGIVIMTNGVSGAGLRTDLIRYVGEE